MFQSPLFWLLLAATVVLHWRLPRRWRMSFLAAVSIAYVVAQGEWTAEGLRDAGLMAGSVLAWALAFYFLTPLAVRTRPAAVATPRSALTSIPAPQGGSGGTSTLTALPPVVPRLAPLRGPGHRWVMWLLILGSLAYLAWFKYVMPWLSPSAEGDPLHTYLVPLGISYFTFKFIHYAVEVARGNIVDRSIGRYLAYVFLFPIFTAGPIERYDHFLRNCDEAWDRRLMTEGLTRIVYGLIKKFFFAEILFGEDFRYAFYGNLVGNLNNLSTPHVWRIAIVSYLYLYAEFSGYTDIALGACRLLGIRIMENFDFPILASNIGDFWKRWHMTLSGWCQTYVYMPVLGLTRRPNLAIYATFVSIGLWHGATPKWVVWGAYHATGLVVYQKWVRTWRRRKWTWPQARTWQVGGIVLTLLFVSAGDLLTFARVASSHDIVRIMGRLVFLRVR